MGKEALRHRLGFNRCPGRCTLVEAILLPALVERRLWGTAKRKDAGPAPGRGGLYPVRSPALRFRRSHVETDRARDVDLPIDLAAPGRFIVVGGPLPGPQRGAGRDRPARLAETDDPCHCVSGIGRVTDIQQENRADDKFQVGHARSERGGHIARG